MAKAEKRISKKLLPAIFIVLVFAVLMLNTYVLRIVLVKGFSMYPTYKSGQIVFARLWEKEYLPGDVIILRSENGEVFIKRIIACGGDNVTIKGGSSVYINGILLDESYAFYNNPQYSENVNTPEVSEYAVPDNCYFVMGDNRNNSMDSRSPELGYIKEEMIVGVVSRHQEQ